MGLIIALIFALVVAGLLARFTRLLPPEQNPCSNDCNQGRNCTCTQSNWPFPPNKKENE